MRYLLLSSFCLGVLFGCKSSYKSLQPTTVNNSKGCIEKFKPQFTRTLYKTQVDVVGKHLSGILLIKQMPDSSTRILFTNEMGFKFFDFEWKKDGAFKVHYMFDKMNKKPVIKTLKKDFELVLMNTLNRPSETIFQQDGNIYHRFKEAKGYNYYITNPGCDELLRIENASTRKTIVSVIMKDYINGVPDTIGVSHKVFNFEIGLKKLQDVKSE